MSKKIVVAFENGAATDAAIAHAAALATALSARICLCGIMAMNDTSASNQFIDPVLWNVTKSEFEAKMQIYADLLKEKNIETEINIIKSPVIEKLCYQNDASEVELIVIPTNGENPSPFAQTLLKHTTIPILLARLIASQPDFKHILVPLDGSQRAENSLYLALSITKAVNGQLHLAHVVQKPEMPHHAIVSTQDLEIEEQVLQRKIEEANRYLDQIATYLGVKVACHVIADNKVTTSIHNLILDHRIDLLVLSAHGHSGESQWPCGTVAENLLRYSEVSTIVVQDLPADLAAQSIDIARIGVH